MPRDFNINGESLVTVKFGQHLPASVSNIGGATNLSELGLTSDAIRITPRFVHTDLRVDDFGPEIPADVLAMLADCSISMTLVHYDVTILDLCLSEALGGAEVEGAGLFNFAGVLPPAGTPLGGYVPYLLSGYHYVSLNIASPQLGFPWHFPAAYLTGPPMELPLGTEKSMVKLNWRAIPYVVPLIGPEDIEMMEPPTEPHDEPGMEFENVQPAVGDVNFAGEISSSGAILWNHVLDT